MSFSCGIVGLPNVGKSTIFNCLTKGNAEVSDYPFCTINPNVGQVMVSDPRLEKLNMLVKPEGLTPATIEFIDIAGLVKGASQGEGLGNRFLAEIRQVDTVLHVLDCFRDGEMDPVEQAKVVNMELALSDLEMLERRLEKVAQMIKQQVEEADEEKELLLRVRDGLQRGIPLRLQPIKAENSLPEWRSNLLTGKPLIIVANVAEKDIGKKLRELEDHANGEKLPVLYISAVIESELLQLSEGEAEQFRKEMDLTESALERLVTTSFSTLGLITFYTVVRRKVSAWTVEQGTLAPQAAGKIHSDMERSFIKGEVVSFRDFEGCGDMKQAKERGLVRVEGKSYPVQDGDIIYFHFK